MDEIKVGARHNAQDMQLIQQIHDNAEALGAVNREEAEEEQAETMAPMWNQEEENPQPRAVTMNMTMARAQSYTVPTDTLAGKAISRREDVNPKEGEREYGDERFADSTNNKYPLTENGALSEERIRAAWNYIHQERNRSKYSASEVAEIEKRIIAAWKEKIDKSGPPAAESKTETADGTLINFGGAVKALSDNEIEGYLVRFGSETEPDISAFRDWFHPQTYFGKRMGAGTDVTFNHGIPLRPDLDWASDRPIGEIKSVTADQYGLLARAIIEADEEYRKVIMQMVREGRLKWSSGAASHLVKRTALPNGTHRIDQWIIAEGALTPTPAEPRLPAIVGLKTFLDWTTRPMQEGSVGAETSAANTETHTASSEIKTGITAEETDMTQEQYEALLAAVNKQSEELAAVKAAWNAPPGNAGAPAVSAVAQNAAPAFNKIPRGDDAFKAFDWYLKSGDASGIRTGEAYEEMQRMRHADALKTTYSLLEGTQYQGQEAVPTEVLNRIVERRDPLSVLRAAGAQVQPAGSNSLVVPIEKASPEVFVITAEGNAMDQTTVQPLDKLTATVYMFTRTVPISIQLLEDSLAPIEPWWSRRLARAWALTENKYFCTGTGSGQPQGLITGGTSAFTSASGLALSAAEVVKLYYSLAAEYRDNIAWGMSGATEATIRQLNGTAFFPFQGNGGYNGGVGVGGLAQGTGWLVDARSRVFNVADFASIGVNNKPVTVFNAEAGYMIVERKGLTVFRDPYTLAANGEVNIIAYFRETGGVVNPLAVQYVTMASA